MSSHLLAWCLAVLLIATSAHAQAPDPPPPVRELRIESSFVGTTGNASTQSFGLGTEAIYRPDGWELRTKLGYVRAESGPDLEAESVQIASRAGHVLTDRASAFVAHGYLRDRFAGIRDRHNVDVGVSFTAAATAAHRLVVDAGLGYARESRLQGRRLSNAALPAGATYVWKISETAEIGEESRLVFSLREASDWRLTNALSLTAKLTALVSLKVGHTLRFVNRPVEGFRQTDTVTSLALVARF